MATRYITRHDRKKTEHEIVAKINAFKGLPRLPFRGAASNAKKYAKVLAPTSDSPAYGFFVVRHEVALVVSMARCF